MASPAQILANQANAQHSTGPKSAEGKAASAQNAGKHGLASAFRVLAHEDQDEFNQLLANLEQEHQPATEHQLFLVAQLAKTQWLLARAQRLEARAFDHLAGSESAPADPDSAIVAKMYETNPNALLTLQRYAQNAERSYYKAFRELAASKQIQNEANYIAGVASVSVVRRLVNAPMPDHPAYGPEPAATQYGHIPQMSAQADNIRDAARDGGAKLTY